MRYQLLPLERTIGRLLLQNYNKPLKKTGPVLIDSKNVVPYHTTLEPRTALTIQQEMREFQRDISVHQAYSSEATSSDCNPFWVFVELILPRHSTITFEHLNMPTQFP